jgi:glycosyl transferase, family 25
LRVHFLNLDRSKDRLAEFKHVNSHLSESIRIPAVDGQRLDVASLARQGIVTEDILTSYHVGALGAAVSQLALWDLAIKIGQPLTICEDDAIFNRQFDLHAEQVIRTLPAEWDLVLWGWNFDSVLSVAVLPGVANSQILFEQTSMSLDGAAFRQLSLSPQAFKLLWAWGIPCYTVSSKGAQTLKSMLLPLRPMSITRPDGRLARTFPVTGLDGALNGIYRHISAFACFPPLVLTKNERSRSTIQPVDSGAVQ